MPALRVLHVLNDLSGGGAERLVLELCRRRAPDVHLTVATVAGLGALADDFAAAGVRVVVGGRSRRGAGLGALQRLAAAAREAEVVHTHLWAGDVWGTAAATLADKPLVRTVHNIDRDEEPWRSGVRQGVERMPQLTIAVSEAVARSCRARRIRVIPNGIDLPRYAAPHRGGAGVLAVGRCVPQKGFDVMVAAIERLPGVRCRVAGDGPMRIAHPRVEWLGARRDVPDLLAQADVLAVPSRWEGFGLAAVEGLAAGVPVVASAVDGLPEVVGDAGMLVPPGDAVALAEALGSLLADPSARASLSARGRQAAKAWDIDRMVRAYEAVWRELAGASPSPTTPAA